MKEGKYSLIYSPLTIYNNPHQHQTYFSLKICYSSPLQCYCKIFDYCESIFISSFKEEKYKRDKFFECE